MTKNELQNVDKDLLIAFICCCKMFKNQYPAKGLPYVVSGYRTIQEQQNIREKLGYTSDSQPSGANGLPMAARPGKSKHEQGLAIDVYGHSWNSNDYRTFGLMMIQVNNKVVYPISENDLCHIEIRR